MKTDYVIGLPLGLRLIFSLDAEAAQNELRLRQSRLENIHPLLTQIAGLLRADARQQFATGGDPAWTPLKAATIAAKAKAGLPSRLPSGRIPRRLMQNGVFGPGGILIRTGALRDSWGRKDSPNHAEAINDEDGTVTIGSTLAYAAAMQTGTSGGRGGRSKSAADILRKAGKLKPAQGSGGTPARPVVITDTARQQVADTAEDYFLGDTNAPTTAPED